jgi:hypothetical protein
LGSTVSAEQLCWCASESAAPINTDANADRDTHPDRHGNTYTHRDNESLGDSEPVDHAHSEPKSNANDHPTDMATSRPHEDGLSDQTEVRGVDARANSHTDSHTDFHGDFHAQTHVERFREPAADRDRHARICGSSETDRHRNAHRQSNSVVEPYGNGHPNA